MIDVPREATSAFAEGMVTDSIIEGGKGAVGFRGGMIGRTLRRGGGCRSDPVPSLRRGMVLVYLGWKRCGRLPKG